MDHTLVINHIQSILDNDDLEQFSLIYDHVVNLAKIERVRQFITKKNIKDSHDKIFFCKTCNKQYSNNYKNLHLKSNLHKRLLPTSN